VTIHELLMCVPMFAVLAAAASVDWRSRRIPNWMTLGLILTGLFQSLTDGQLVTPGQSMLGLAAGFSLLFVLFALGAVGAGDVKLMAGIGAWLGPVLVLQVFAAGAVMGMLIVLGQCLKQGRLRALFRNSAVLAINLIHIQELGVQHVTETGQSSASVDKPLPYAVPILFATIAVVLNAWGAGR
jgi:prepilin peptidase CpaA